VIQFPTNACRKNLMHYHSHFLELANLEPRYNFTIRDIEK
jgi:hypothetical protein